MIVKLRPDSKLIATSDYDIRKTPYIVYGIGIANRNIEYSEGTKPQDSFYLLLEEYREKDIAYPLPFDMHEFEIINGDMPTNWNIGTNPNLSFYDFVIGFPEFLKPDFIVGLYDSDHRQNNSFTRTFNDYVNRYETKWRHLL